MANSGWPLISNHQLKAVFNRRAITKRKDSKMEKYSFTEQDAQIVEQMREVLEEMEFTIEDGFCDQSRLGYRISCDHGEAPFKALITYDPKGEAISAEITFRVIVPPDKFQSTYAHLNDVNSELIFGHFTLCRDCGEVSFIAGFYNKTQEFFKEKFQANLKEILEEAHRGNSSLSAFLSFPVQNNTKEVNK